MLKIYTGLFVILISNSITAYVYAGNSPGYWYDSTNQIVRTGFGECWRTIYWTAENAIAECEGGMVKEKITEKDSDHDGVIDSMDQCPATAAGTSVDAQGCPMDTDKDGITDARDKCPRTPEGTAVDSSGCSKDSDKDGIFDASDDCPNTTRGTVVDNRGCKLQASIDLDHVQFKTGTDILSDSSKSILDRVASTLNDNPHLVFEVAGHTDNTGNYQNNINLSENRASSVRQYLINRGVAADRLKANGYGPDKPVASNETREGRSRNRRVELVLQ